MIKNKTTLLELKNELTIIKEGQNVLEQKRDALIKEIMKIVDIVDMRRRKLNEHLRSCYNVLIKAFMETGGKIEKEDFVKTELKVVEKTFLGLVVPKIDFKISSNPKIKIDSNIFTDLAKENFFEALKMILELSEMEIKIWKLSQELKKTMIRVNALKFYYMPKYETEIKQIKNHLEENEREFISIIKKLKKY